MLKIRFISLKKIRSMDKKTKINTLINHLQKNELIIIDGKLSSKEEADLIRTTMNDINKKFNDDKFMEFNGIELAYLTDNPSKKENVISKIKNKTRNIFNIKNISGITIIGPATIIKEIKQYPEYLELKIK